MSKGLLTYFASEFRTPNPRIIPTMVEIDLTNSCDQECIYCCSKHFRNTTKSVAKFKHFETLLDQIAKWGVKAVIFIGGGEPTLFKHYELLIKKSIDLGLMTSLVTNGAKLDELLELDPYYAQKIQWIGVDIDSADLTIFNEVRQPKNKNNFEQVMTNIKLLVDTGATIDLKVLLLEETISNHNIKTLFNYASRVKVHMLYFRAAVLDYGTGNVFHVNHRTRRLLDKYSKEYGVHYRFKKREESDTRTYTKCYALYLLPVFAADGKIYLCCENRGNEDLALCDWITEDWQEVWCSEKHEDIFELFDISNCPACRPDPYNTEIQGILDNPIRFEELYF